MRDRLSQIEGKQAWVMAGEISARKASGPWAEGEPLLMAPCTGLPLMDQLAPSCGWHSLTPFVN